MKVIVVLAAILAAVAADPKSYDGYKTYRVVPSTNLDLALLSVFRGDSDIDFWTTPRAVNQQIDTMVAPQKQTSFESFLKKYNIAFSVIINDVERVVKAEKTRLANAPKVPEGRISFTQYHRYSEIQAYLEEMASTHAEIASTFTIGTTTEGRSLSGIKISTGGNGKPAIIIDGGIHAREWISPAMCLFIINQLVENTDNSAMIEKVDWYIVPVLNPDGYEYSHTTERFWRKTRRVGSRCDGVDANRNFDFHWMETGASDFECDETYAGPMGFSEPETKALRDFIITNAGALKLYLTFHSYGQYLLYPWGYTSALPDDAPELQTLGEKVNDAISTMFGTTYEVGSSTNVLYAAAGGSDDWAKGVGGVQLSYTIELPGGGSWGFDLPPSRIQDVVDETFMGVQVYHDYIKNKFT